MTETGGPTTQAGIDYQNRIAALHLGDLLRFDADISDSVVSVRGEAPEHVDDIVVRYADGHWRHVQVKLVVSPKGADWAKLWRDFHAQRHSPAFSAGDRLCLTVGESDTLAHSLRECAQRTTSSGEDEWRRRLTDTQAKLVAGIEAAIGEPSFPIFQCLDVESFDNTRIDLMAAERMPKASVPAETVLSVLQALAGEGSRRRQEFQASALRARLLREHGIRIEPPAHWGMKAYLETVAEDTISVPGTSVGGSVRSAFHWPLAVRSTDTTVDFDDEQSLYRREPSLAEFDLRLFPGPQITQCIVHAGPGFGKSALLAAIATRAVDDGVHTPAIISLSDLSECGHDVISYLHDRVNKAFTVNIDWTRLCDLGSALILFDGLDEVPLAERISVTRKVERFALRFARTPWMLTVRDLAVLPGGFEAEKLELLPLTDEEMVSFFVTVSPPTSRDEARRFIDRVTAYPDLERLVRIPLFLSLLIATWTPPAPAPTRRSDLIESYLKTLFRPEEHKSSARASAPELLRDAMQALAYRLVDSGEVGTTERTVRKFLAEHASSGVTADMLFDDAIRCGILKRLHAGRLVFPFPIVQEYLAGQQLVEHHPSELPQRTAQAIQRPWAQTVQFALERLPDGTQIAMALLDTTDDAFITRTRLLARCIVNGMSCSEAVRKKVGDRLANVWHRQSFFTATRVGRLIDDGWSDPPGAAVRKALKRRGLMHDGAARILGRLKDDGLTLEALRSYVRRPGYGALAGDLKPAVDRIASQALGLFIDAVRAGNFEKDTWAPSSLICELNPDKLDREDLERARDDESLPIGVRLAVLGLMGDEPSPLFWSLAQEALRHEDTSNHWAAIKALRRMTNPKAHLGVLLHDPTLPETSLESIVDCLDDVIPVREEQALFLSSVYHDAAIPAGVRVRMRLRAAVLGHRPTFETLLNELAELSVEHADHVLQALSNFPEPEIGERVVAALLARNAPAPDRVKLVNALMLGAMYKYDNFTYNFGAITPAPPHPSFADFLAVLEAWWSATTGEDLDALAMTSLAARHGLPGAPDRLLELATETIHCRDTRGFENPYNGAIRTALEELARKRIYIDLPSAIRLAENTDSNAEIGALSHIGAMGTREAFDYLLHRIRHDTDNYSTLFQGIEAISSRLGLKVIETDSGLALADT